MPSPMKCASPPCHAPNTMSPPLIDPHASNTMCPPLNMRIPEQRKHGDSSRTAAALPRGEGKADGRHGSGIVCSLYCFIIYELESLEPSFRSQLALSYLVMAWNDLGNYSYRSACTRKPTTGTASTASTDRGLCLRGSLYHPMSLS